MANDRIKVAGYSQRVFFNDQIEYRNFSPDLVGFQLASDGNTPLFTIGNFAVTTNLEPKKNKVFTTTKFSNFVTLTDLDLSLQQTLELLQNNAGVYLNLDKRNLGHYALFGSLREVVRVALENVITNWPAALYVNKVYAIEPDYNTQTGYTFQNCVYDNIADISTFKVNVNVINNQYSINFLKNGTLQGTYNEGNDLRNLTTNYASYAISYNGKEYDIINFVGSNRTINDYITITVKGNVFSGLTNEYFSYYIKPNKDKENLFFNGLDDFEAYILNRLVFPKYTATFDYTIKADTGNLLYVSESLTWPTSDGYNLDYDTDAYTDYATKLLELSTNYDLSISNLMVRFLVTESITDFDTTFTHLDPLDQDTSEQKVNKTLTIYGLEYDKINQFIVGVKFANTVTYNKQDNTPDKYLKNLSRVLGWDLISSVLENNLLKAYIEPGKSTYSGQSVGLTPMEADIELWRRIILNTPWIWKSKGARKSIEFLFKFIGTPLGLIQFNEYIYLAEKNIDVDLFFEELSQNKLLNEYVFSTYPIDFNGYPSPLPNTSQMYFQSNGLWYRETGGDNANIDITSGNNPHVGPYDGGYKYINQFRELIPGFKPVTVTSETLTTTTGNLFTNYNLGTMTSYSGNTYVNITNEDGLDISNCYVVKSDIIPDPKGRYDESVCGCVCPENLKSLSICIQKNTKVGKTGKEPVHSCTQEIGGNELVNPEGYYMYSYYQYTDSGAIYTNSSGQPIFNQSIFVDPYCCNGIPYYYNQVTGNGELSPFVLNNSGYICCESKNTCGCFVTCKWKLDSNIPTQVVNGNTYLLFTTELNTKKVVSQDGCNCIGATPKGILTTPVQITDPNTGEIGYGCQVTPAGLSDLALGSLASVLMLTYKNRANGSINCTDIKTK